MYVYKKKIYTFLFSVLDILGNIVFLPSRMFRRAVPGRADRILLIRGDHIGDVIAATSALEPLRKAFPGAAIDFMAPSWAADILKGNPYLDDFVLFDPPWFDRGAPGFARQLKGLRAMATVMRNRNYDLAIDLRGDVRHITAMFMAGIRHRISYGITGGGFLLTCPVPYEGVMHETERNMRLLRPLGVQAGPPKAGLRFSDSDREKAGSIKKEAGIGGAYAVLHAVPGHPTKDWDASGFAKVARYIHDEKKLVPVMVGAADDKDRVKEVMDVAGVDIADLSGKTSLGVLGPVLSGASLFIGVDSGPSHIAAAVGTPTVILFSGINDPARWAPRGDKVRVVYPGQGKDLSAVDPDEVLKIIDEVMGI